MKKILFIIATLFVLNTQAQFKQATLQASGLTCAMCSKAIYKALEKLPFVAKVQSNIKESSFTMQFKQNGPVEDLDAIRSAVEAAGFSVATLKVTANFNDVSVQNDAHVLLNGKSLHFINVKQQVLNGDQEFKIVDKKFVSDKAYKQYAAYTKMECIKTGIMESCCAKGDAKAGSRIYHVTI